jgi:hypothetical protein
LTSIGLVFTVMDLDAYTLITSRLKGSADLYLTGSGLAMTGLIILFLCYFHWILEIGSFDFEERRMAFLTKKETQQMKGAANSSLALGPLKTVQPEDNLESQGPTVFEPETLQTPITDAEHAASSTVSTAVDAAPEVVVDSADKMDEQMKQTSSH